MAKEPVAMESGIYQIKNAITGDFYIGSASNLRQRLRDHRRRLVNNAHVNEHLQRAYNKYGAENFEYSMLEYCEKEQAIEREQYYIDSESPAYNMCPTAGSRLGVKHTDAARVKISTAMKGKNKGNTSRLGCTASAETLVKMSEAQKGGRHTEEHNRKIGEALRGNTNTLGHTLTEETKQKISKTRLERYGKRATGS